MDNWCKLAIEVQDACNLSGVVHAFGRIQSEMVAQGMRTDERNQHPVTRMFVAKMADLAGIEYTFPSKDYVYCIANADPDKE